jgi:hypothetical protein
MRADFLILPIHLDGTDELAPCFADGFIAVWLDPNCQTVSNSTAPAHLAMT